MKKLSIITILFLCVFVCISSAQAIPVIYSAAGTIYKEVHYSWVGNFYYDYGDPLGWHEQQFYMEMKIDSNKPPDDSGCIFIPPWPKPYYLCDAYYTPDTFDFYVGGINQNFVGTELYLQKNYDDSLNYVSVFAKKESTEGTSLIDISTVWPLDAIGDVLPISAMQFLDPDESIYRFAQVRLDGLWIYSMQNFSFAANPVPEPSTLLLLGAGLVGLAAFGRKRFKK